VPNQKRNQSGSTTSTLRPSVSVKASPRAIASMPRVATNGGTSPHVMKAPLM
jgi:hypothetical protein